MWTFFLLKMGKVCLFIVHVLQGWTIFPKIVILLSTNFCNWLFFQWIHNFSIKNRLIYFNQHSLKDHMHTNLSFIAFLSKHLVKSLKFLFQISSRKVSNPLFFPPHCGPLLEEGSSLMYLSNFSFNLFTLAMKMYLRRIVKLDINQDC